MSAPKPIHPNKKAFIEGTELILYSWTALDLAVKQGWGGPDSYEKRDWILDVIVEAFDKKGAKIDEDYIEDQLIQIMDDEFETVLEDGSPAQVARLICQLYRACIKGDFSITNSLKQKSQKQNTSNPPQPQPQPEFQSQTQPETTAPSLEN